MNILITGGKGMVGKNLKKFLEQKREYKVYDPSKKELDLFYKKKIGDYIDKYKVDIISHCAGKVGGINRNIAKPYTFLNDNTLMGLNLLNASIEKKIERLINISSANIYPLDQSPPLSEDYLGTGELDTLTEGYSLSKLTILKACGFISKQFGLNYKTLIPCNLYGPFDKFDKNSGHLIPSAIIKTFQSKKNKSSVEIWGDGTARRELLFAEDLASFILFSIENYEKMEAVTNVGVGLDHSVKEVYSILGNIIETNQSFTFDTLKPTGRKSKLLSVKKQKKLGWQPKHTLKEGLIKTVDYYRQKYDI